MEKIDDLWNSVLERIQQSISKPSFETWVKSTKAHSLQGNAFVVTAPNVFNRDWLEGHYTTLTADILKDITDTEMDVYFISPDAHDLDTYVPPSYRGKGGEETPSYARREDANGDVQSMLNAKYTFDTFVIGSGNRFAHAAALAVAEAPAKAYNPLFIYGGVGLGKTHLMHAIGHYVLDHDPNAKVVYLSSEKFTNEFINSIRDNKAVEFRNKYRNVDVLLIDDIQFLAGKEQTQEEFFHTFNTLHEESKHIVISSDRPPKEIPTLEDRLRSRFEWGLITDITPPDLETRIAILRKKARAENLDVPNEVMLYIANQIDSNIRELEGALTRVMAYSSLSKQEVNADVASDALKNIMPDSRSKALTMEDIQRVVGDYYGIDIGDFATKKRTKTVAFPRQVAMYLSRELTEFSLPRIGEAFGGRDHSTVIHAHEKISVLMEKDPSIAQQMKDLAALLKT